MDYLTQMQRTGTISVQKQQSTNASSNEYQRNAFYDRIIQVQKDKLLALEKEVFVLKTDLKKAMEFIAKVEDKQVVANAREALSNRRDRPPVDRPIDRNNVAPKDVSIENIFYSGSRRQ